MPPRILILGAGLVAGPLVRYLAKRQFPLTIASNDLTQARHLVESRHLSQHAIEIVAWNADDSEELRRLIDASSIVVSLLPATMHLDIARACIALRRNLVTASYVSPEMRALNREAKHAGVTLLNELGLDPGIDHMSAMYLLDDIRAQGERVLSFHSYCGGLPAPDARTNPWDYKFSWSPIGVLRAARASARYLDRGQIIDVPAEAMTQYRSILHFDGVGELEAYPNRDATQYLDLYRLRDLETTGTLYRGTLRYPGWIETMDALRKLGLLSDDPFDARGEGFLAPLVDRGLASGNLLENVAAFLRVEPTSLVIRRLEWLGLFQADAARQIAHLFPKTILDGIAALMSHTMTYRSGECDMVVMRHDIISSKPETGSHESKATKKRYRSSLVVFGELDGETAMAQTVGLPVAIGTRLLLENQIESGVVIPVLPQIYQPILRELDELGIRMTEQVEEIG